MSRIQLFVMQSLRSSLATRTIVPSASGRSAVVARVKPKTAAEFRALSYEELISQTAAHKAEYTKLQYLKSSNPENIQVSSLL